MASRIKVKKVASLKEVTANKSTTRFRRLIVSNSVMWNEMATVADDRL